MVVGGSVKGYRKREKGVCEDASTFVSNKTYAVSAVSDGLGSCHYSNYGANIAVHTAIEEMSKLLQSSNDASSIDWRQSFLDIIEKIKSKIVHRCSDIWEVPEGNSSRPATIDDFACNLIISVLTPTTFAAYFIGDGVLVAKKGDEYALLAEPFEIDTPNTTTFLDDNYIEMSTFITQDASDITEVFLMSDGIQRNVLQQETLALHIPFFENLSRFMKSPNKNPSEKTKEILKMLDSEKINNRKNDDDKSLIVMALT